MTGNIQLNRIPGPTADPLNLAEARSSCTDCQSLAVALQINLISRTATQITPENSAVAVNSQCTGCYTVARALQYDLQVGDPAQVPPDVSQLMAQMNQKLTTLETTEGLQLDQAEAGVNSVIASFTSLAQALDDKRNATTATTSP